MSPAPASVLSRRLRTVEAVLTVLLVLLVLWIGALLLGPNGLGVVGDLGGPIHTDTNAVMAVTTELDTRVTVAGAPTTTDTTDGTRDAVSGGRPVEISGPYVAQVSFLDPSPAQRVIWLLSELVGPLLASVIVILLLLVAVSARRGDPFTRANTARLRAIAALVMVGGTAVSFLSSVVSMWLVAESPAGRIVTPSVSITLLPLLVGLLVLALAEVWNRGVALREDTEGLV